MVQPPADVVRSLRRGNGLLEIVGDALRRRFDRCLRRALSRLHAASDEFAHRATKEGFGHRRSRGKNRNGNFGQLRNGGHVWEGEEGDGGIRCREEGVCRREGEHVGIVCVVAVGTADDPVGWTVRGFVVGGEGCRVWDWRGWWGCIESWLVRHCSVVHSTIVSTVEFFGVYLSSNYGSFYRFREGGEDVEECANGKGFANGM